MNNQINQGAGSGGEDGVRRRTGPSTRERASVILTVRVTPSEAAVIGHNSRARHLSRSDYMRTGAIHGWVSRVDVRVDMDRALSRLQSTADRLRLVGGTDYAAAIDDAIDHLIEARDRL